MATLIENLEKQRDEEAGGVLQELEKKLAEKQNADTKMQSSVKNQKELLNKEKKNKKGIEKSYAEVSLQGAYAHSALGFFFVCLFVCCFCFVWVFFFFFEFFLGNIHFEKNFACKFIRQKNFSWISFSNMGQWVILVKQHVSLYFLSRPSPKTDYIQCTTLWMRHYSIKFANSKHNKPYIYIMDSNTNHCILQFPVNNYCFLLSCIVCINLN